MLNDIRKARNMQWSEVAARVGTTAPFLRAISLGHVPAGHLTKAIADEFGVTPQEVRDIRVSDEDFGKWVRRTSRERGINVSRLSRLSGEKSATIKSIMEGGSSSDETRQSVIDALMLNNNALVLRRKREESGITAAEVSAASGIDTARIEKAESGAVTLDNAEASAFVRALSNTPEDEESVLRTLGIPCNSRKAELGAKIKKARAGKGLLVIHAARRISRPISEVNAAEGGYGDGVAAHLMCLDLGIASPFPEERPDYPKWLKSELKSRDMSVNRLAALADLSLRVTKNVLDGSHEPGPWTRLAIEEALEEQGATLRTFRNWAKMTQAGLAKKSSVATSTISMIEQGKYRPPANVLQRLADALGVDGNDILLVDSPGIELVRRREALALSQRELSRASGVSRNRISAYESGQGELEESELEVINEALSDFSGLDIGQKVHRARLRMGYSQGVAASVIGTSQKSLSELERGKALPTPSIQKKAEAFLEKDHPGAHLRRLREMGSLTRKELAEQVGCSERHLAGVEAGAHMPSDALAMSLASAVADSVRESLTSRFVKDVSPLRTARLNRGLKQHEVGEAVGCSGSHVSLVERGMVPDSPYIKVISDFLGVN